MDKIAPDHSLHVISAFKGLIAGRNLPIDTIIKIFVLAQGALWTFRHTRTPATSHGTSSRPVSPMTDEEKKVVEHRILTHLLALHRVLLELGVAELDESTNIAKAETDLAMRLTATLRRTLPALRISGKWLRANIDSLSMTAYGASSDLADGLDGFWEIYFRFSQRVIAAFPPDALPQLRLPLDEDLDMRGFLPLKGLMASSTETRSLDQANDTVQSTVVRPTEQVHPNEEQLMRIWDIWNDARLLNAIHAAKFNRNVPEAGSSTFEDDRDPLSNGDEQEHRRPFVPPPPSVSTGSSEFDDDARTETTDPVGDAFRQALNVEDDDEDEIVWNPRYVIHSFHSGQVIYGHPSAPEPLASASSPVNNIATPHVGAHARMSPISPLSPTTNLSPPHPPGGMASLYAQPTNTVSSTPRGTTAQDLLHNVMGVGRLTSSPMHHPRNPPLPLHLPTQVSNLPNGPPSSSSPSLLFGSASPGGIGSGQQSIWATAPDEGPLRYHQRRPSGSLLLSSPLSANPYGTSTPSQSAWPSTGRHMSQPPPNTVSTPVTPFGSDFNHRVWNNHRRMPSASIAIQDHHYGDFAPQVPDYQYQNPSGHHGTPLNGPALYNDLPNRTQEFGHAYDPLALDGSVTQQGSASFGAANVPSYIQSQPPTTGRIWSG